MALRKFENFRMKFEKFFDDFKPEILVLAIFPYEYAIKLFD